MSVSVINTFLLYRIKVASMNLLAIAKGRAKSNVLTSSLPPRGGAYSRVLIAGKS